MKNDRDLLPLRGESDRRQQLLLIRVEDAVQLVACVRDLLALEDRHQRVRADDERLPLDLRDQLLIERADEDMVTHPDRPSPIALAAR